MKQSIPKIIHYCWFGSNPKNELILKCIESWKKYLPDYEVREWNDDDLKNCQNKYVMEALTCKKWAFISDYFRLYALYNYGGIYLDSDNEVFKSFDEFLDLDFFTGYEKWYDNISPFTAVVGAKAGNKIIKDLLDEYNEISFLQNGEPNMETNTYRVSLYFKEKYKLEPPYSGTEKLELEKNCIIYPYNYFCNYEKDISYAVHHFNASWAPWLKSKLTKLFRISNYNFYKYKSPNMICINSDLSSNEKILLKLKRGKNKYYILTKS